MRDPNERWNLRFSLTAVRPPAPGVIAVGAFALALLIGTVAGLEDSTSGMPVWTRLWRRYVADFVTAAVVTMGVAGLRKATPDRWYLDSARPRAFAISYGTYLAIGVLGGLARFLMFQAVDVPPLDASATHHAARAGAIAAGMLLLGFVANQYNAFIDNIRAEERALRQRIADLNRENQERLQAERAATMKGERLAAMLRTMDEGVILADREGRVVLLNPAAARIVGRSNEEAAGRPLAEVLPRLVDLDARELLVRRPDGFPHEVEIEGASRFLEAAVAPIAEGPEVGGRLLLIRDVTEKKLAEQRAGQEERLVSLGKLSAGIAHDFNNLHHRTIAVVVTDITMPVMGGFELYRTLRGRNPDVKLIALTGHAFDEETRRYLASGMVDWLEKPPDTGLLARTLRRVIEGEAGESSDQSRNESDGPSRRADQSAR